MHPTTHRVAPAIALILMSATLAACGGGGSKSAAAPPAPPPPAVAPAAPKVQTAVETKTLVLSWTAVADATSYRVLRDATGLAGFSQWGDSLPASTTSARFELSVHLLDWVNSRYRVEACNAVGCTTSTTLFLTPADPRAATGFFKATNTGNDDYFGYSVALSGDGRRMAIGAIGEDSDSADHPDDDSLSNAGAVYTFARNAQGLWVAEGVVKPLTPRAADAFGTSLALSFDGTTLAVGAPHESSAATGVDGDAADSSAVGAGAVYVFERNGSSWSRQGYLKASNTAAGDDFGRALGLSGNGNLLVVGAPQEDSAASGIGGGQGNDLAVGAGAVYLFRRDGSKWVAGEYVKASNAGADRQFGFALAVSRDGSAFAVAAPGDDSGATGIDGNQSGNTRPDSGAVYVFRSGKPGWSQEAYVKASRAIAGLSFGYSLALDGDGQTLAVGAPVDASNATGIDGNPDDTSAPLAGAVFVFSHFDGPWAQQAYLKAANTDGGDLFGYQVALSDSGNVLVAGAPGEDSNASGVGGNADDDSVQTAGATYVFTRNRATWTARSYVKGFGVDAQDGFGRAVALSADGAVLAVGSFDDSNTRGAGVGGQISNRPDDNLAPDSGAVFLF